MPPGFSPEEERAMLADGFSRSSDKKGVIVFAAEVNKELGLDFWDLYREHREWLHAHALDDHEPIEDDEVDVMAALTMKIRNER